MSSLGFRLLPIAVTLNDLERRSDRRPAQRASSAVAEPLVYV